MLLLVVLTSVGLKARWVLLRIHPRSGISFRVMPVSLKWRLVRARAGCLFFRKPIVVSGKKRFRFWIIFYMVFLDWQLNFRPGRPYCPEF